jgi:branched-chain amino acid transport system ATP-binding protein
VDTLCEALQALNRAGLTILLVEQDVATAFDIASNAFVMDSGRVTRAGTSATLRDDPAIREAYLGVI